MRVVTESPACAEAHERGTCAAERSPGAERSGDGRVEARFALAMQFAVEDKPAVSEAVLHDAFLLDHMFAALDPHERIEFVVQRKARDYEYYGHAQATFAVHGSARAESASAAQSRAAALQAALQSMLAARADVGFAPDAAPAESFACTYFAEPCGILLATQSGPLAKGPEVLPVALPAPSLIEARVPFWDALLGCQFALEIRVSVEQVHLEGAALQSLAHIYERLQEGRARCETLPERQWLNDTQVRLSRRHFEAELARWLRLRDGVKVRIALATPEPAPPAALRPLAQTLLPMRRIEVKPAAPGARELGRYPQCVDLRECLNESEAMPPLLPDRRTVSRLGLPPRLVAPQGELPRSGLLLGHAADRQVRLPPHELDRHCYILGATGCGKSSLLVNMILQDIAAGRGVAVLDPHGDLYRDVLVSIPRRRAADVVLFDPSDPGHAPGLNYLDLVGANPAVERNFVANEMICIFDRLYDLRQTGGPVFEQYMRNAILLLADAGADGMTLVEVPLLFEDDEFRARLIERCTDPTVTRFWKCQAERVSGEHSLRNMAPYITSKLNQFTANALVRPIVGQSRSTIDLRALIDGGRIFLANLSKGLLGEIDSALLGMLLVSKLFLAALGRADTARGARQPFHLYVDEFQSFTTPAVAGLLSEARKFGLRCVLANQYLAQLDAGRGAHNLLDAVLGNAGTILAMRVGVRDAAALSDALGGQFSPGRLQRLPDFHVAARWLPGALAREPFVFQTLPPAQARRDEVAQRTIRANLARYARPAAAVEQEITARARFWE